MRTVEIKDMYNHVLAFEVYYDNGDVELLEGPFSKKCRLPIVRYCHDFNETIEIPSRRPVGKGNLVRMYVRNFENQ